MRIDYSQAVVMILFLGVIAILPYPPPLPNYQLPIVAISKCGCTFRVYPKGVNKKQTSMRVQGMAVMLYILGLSYGAVELVLVSLGVGIGKTSVYRAVQSAAEKVPGMKQKNLLNGYKTKAVGADVTSVGCNGK